MVTSQCHSQRILKERKSVMLSVEAPVCSSIWTSTKNVRAMASPSAITHYVLYCNFSFNKKNYFLQVRVLLPSNLVLMHFLIVALLKHVPFSHSITIIFCKYCNFFVTTLLLKSFFKQVRSKRTYYHIMHT